MTEVEKYRMLGRFTSDFAGEMTWVYMFDDTKRELEMMNKALGYKIPLVSMNDILNEKVSSITTWVLICELPPLNSQMHKLSEICPQDKVLGYISLESPFFSIFGGDRISSLMKQLGIAENETIEHTMINRSILKAQKKIEKQIQNVIECNDSLLAWMDANHVLN